MTCSVCGGRLKSRRENHRYTESGLTRVTLINVEVRTCPTCGERELVIPRIEELHRVVAHAISARPGKLVPNEIRFLRTYLGWSGVDFARYMGVKAETVSRWEHGTQDMGLVADRLLRLFVANQKPVTHYPIEIFKQPEGRTAMLKFKADPAWRAAAA